MSEEDVQEDNSLAKENNAIVDSVSEDDVPKNNNATKKSNTDS